MLVSAFAGSCATGSYRQFNSTCDRDAVILRPIAGVILRGNAMRTKAADQVDKYVGSRIRMRRLMLGMSQGKLGDALGLTFQQVQKYEKGTNRVGASRLQQISQILQVPPAFFFEGAPGQRNSDGKESPASYVSEFLATSDGLALAHAFGLLDAKLRRYVVALVEELAIGKKCDVPLA
jgi:transcriptional regulator with XRE-family HTH domain